MSQAIIHWISGPVLRAHSQDSFILREAVHIGEQRLLGEVISLFEQEITVQVYEDTSGLRTGSIIHGSGLPLSVTLGPGILGEIFDGLMRPICALSEGVFVKPGMIDRQPRSFPFEPLVNNGDMLSAGSRVGTVKPPEGQQQYILVPPNMSGRVIDMVTADHYEENVVLCQLQQEQGENYKISMNHLWSVREPRPVVSRLPSDEPMITGQRIIDCLFPIARGSKGAIPGGFGTGKTVILETLAKWCDADVIVYVGCGERGNELAGMLKEFRHLEDPRSGRLLHERTVIIANTSNMPVAAREASIYTAVTVAEYFRDQGMNVALMADSTSRWAEALREISGRLGELPGEAGYPAYLSSRLAEFYERAATVKTLAGQLGSVTLMGAISPPSGDFSEPVTSHTRRYIRSLWSLDAQRAQARFFPAIHPLKSYSIDAPMLARWWHKQGCTRWLEIRNHFLTLLEEGAKLERMARIIGKESMPPKQRLILLCVELINEAFLRQSAFSLIDRFALPERQAVMMRLLSSFIEQSEQAVKHGISPENISNSNVFRRLMRMSEELKEGDWEGFSDLSKQVDITFSDFTNSTGIDKSVQEEK
ncbi:MAG: V-type ATP synthase subunit A [Gammaproteobacteria bacterium]|nr:V-type ATP synthase subunit A [Gammaproteobacteria bacterium]